MGTASPRAVCVCGDRDLSRVIDRALVAANVVVEHHDAIPDQLEDAVLVVIDRATRLAAGETLRTIATPVVVVGDDLDDDGLITLMLEAPVSHLVRDPDDGDLGITSQKLVSGDLFGLEKYVAAGVRIGERVIATDSQKRVAMGEVCAWAEAVGARRPVVHRLASVVDELLMNALHDAPRESKPTLAVDNTALPFGSAADRGQAPAVDNTALPFGSAADRGQAPAVDNTALPFGSAADRGQAPAVDNTALPFGSAADRGQAPAVDSTALPFGSAADRGQAPAVDSTALPFGSAADRGQAPAVDSTALPFGSAADRGQAPAVDSTALPFGSAADRGQAPAVDGTGVAIRDHRAILRWACDERTLAVSIGDAYGALRQRDVIDHVRRARDERGRPEWDEPGAGLGLYLVLANVASLIVNVDPGRRTEVVCLFDLARGKQRAVASGVRSLHVFAS